MLYLFKKREENNLRDLLPAELFNNPFSTILGPKLASMGFEEIRTNHWVSDTGKGVRKVVEIRHWKGSCATPCWGYSLDYVPHFDNRFKEIHWHRTNKSAMLDIYPIYYDFFRFEFSKFNQLHKHVSAVESKSTMIIKELDAFYQLGSSTNDLLKIIEKSKSCKPPHLGFDTASQMQLAYVFVLNKIGAVEHANLLLKEYISRYKIHEKSQAKLQQRFEMARS